MSEFPLVVSAAVLRQHLDDDDWRVLDCRSDLMDPGRGLREFGEGHIPGAVFADQNRHLAGPVRADSGRHPLPDRNGLIARLGAWGIDSAATVIAYDGGSGALAARAWWLLRWLGHERVALLDGGFAGWVSAGLPVSTRPPAHAARAFQARRSREQVVTTADIAAMVAEQRPLRLVDARDAPRFRGEVEPIDAVAGHVPGAQNFPYAQSLRADGFWRAPAELRQLWRPVLGEPPGEPWMAMCGSGVTACHIAISARLAGFEAPSLYVGSWSEWIRDPSRPIAGLARR